MHKVPPQKKQQHLISTNQNNNPLAAKTFTLLEAVALPVQDLEVQVITTDSSWDE